MIVHPLITDSQTLAELCARLAKSPFVTVDTEFMRENSYWPDLCLIQIADLEEAAAIDPKAPGIDLKPLLDLLVDNEEVLKVFHAGGQDLEIVHNLTGKTPHPLFDTQVAAMALGMGEQIGYQNLVETMLKIKVDKGARFTDWGRRPLDARQIDYAIGDVTHLSALFPRMLDKLRATGRGGWLDQEMDRLGDPASYLNIPDLAWTRIKAPSRRPEVLGRLKALAAWREREAQNKNLATRPHRQGRDACRHCWSSARQAGRPCQSTRPLNHLGAERHRSTLDGGSRKCGALARSEMPVRDDRRPGLGKEASLIADLLKLLLKVRAREADAARN